MKARTVTVRPSLGASVSVVVVAIAAYAALPPWRFSWWPFAAITVAALILLLVRVRRHSFVTWVAARVRHRRTRRYTTPSGRGGRHPPRQRGVRRAHRRQRGSCRDSGRRPSLRTDLPPRLYRRAHGERVAAGRAGSVLGSARWVAHWFRHRVGRIPRASRIRVPAALQHPARGARRGRSASHLSDCAAGHPRVADQDWCIASRSVPPWRPPPIA